MARIAADQNLTYLPLGDGPISNLCNRNDYNRLKSLWLGRHNSAIWVNIALAPKNWGHSKAKMTG